jgi:hypothetical protein
MHDAFVQAITEFSPSTTILPHHCYSHACSSSANSPNASSLAVMPHIVIGGPTPLEFAAQLASLPSSVEIRRRAAGKGLREGKKKVELYVFGDREGGGDGKGLTRCVDSEGVREAIVMFGARGLMEDVEEIVEGESVSRPALLATSRRRRSVP